MTAVISKPSPRSLDALITPSRLQGLSAAMANLDRANDEALARGMRASLQSGTPGFTRSCSSGVEQ